MNLAPIRPISEQFAEAYRPILKVIKNVNYFLKPSLALTDKDRKVRDAGMLLMLYDRILTHFLVTNGLQKAWEEECLRTNVAGGVAFSCAVEKIRQLKIRKEELWPASPRGTNKNHHPETENEP